MTFGFVYNFFSASNSSVFRRVSEGRLHEPCSVSVQEHYLSVEFTTNCLLFEHVIVEVSIPFLSSRKQ